MKGLYFYLWYVSMAIYECQRLVDRNKFSNMADLLDICALQDNPNLNMNCNCDKSGFRNATKAECWVYNDPEKESSSIWDEFRSQPKLSKFSLHVRSKPSLSYIPTRLLAGLPELLQFNLLYANVTTVVPYAFANLTSLQRLELKKNQIQTLEKYSMANLASLQEVNLGQNRIREIGRDTFRNLPSLKRLHLEENAIKAVQDLAFAELKSLEELQMYKNQLTAVSRNTFAGLTSLRRLDLHSNLLSELKDFTFAEMSELRELIVDQNMIESIGEKVFYGIQHLDRLVLAENKLHILPDDVFASLPQLRVLDLRDNLLQTFSYETALPILDKLKNESFVFYIESNRLECDCNLSWLRSLANDTANEQLRTKLKQLSCYMKGDYYRNDDGDQEMNTNGLSDSRSLGESVDVLSDGSRHQDAALSDKVDRMLKLFNIPMETLPCPEKRQANEILMEQMSKHDAINRATSLLVYDLSVMAVCCCILITTKAFIL